MGHAKIGDEEMRNKGQQPWRMVRMWFGKAWRGTEVVVAAGG